jgi:putative membrane protein
MRLNTWSRIGILAATLLGLAIAVWTIGDVGLMQIAETARRMGAGGFAAVCAWSLFTSALLGGAWHSAAPGEPPRRVALFAWARLVRDGASNLLPFSELGAILIGWRTLIGASVPAARVYSSFVVDLTTEMASQVVYTLFSLIAIAPLLAGAGAAQLRPAIIGGTAVMIALIVLFFKMQPLVLALAARIAARFLPGATVLDEVQAELSRTYAMRGHVLAAFLFNLAAWTATGTGSWFLLELMGSDIALWKVLSLEGLIFTLRSIAFFVPGAIGVQEAGYLFVAPLFGLAPEAALALSLGKRARDMLIGAAALLIWQIRESRALIAQR